MTVRIDDQEFEAHQLPEPPCYRARATVVAASSDQRAGSEGTRSRLRRRRWPMLGELVALVAIVSTLVAWWWL